MVGLFLLLEVDTEVVADECTPASKMSGLSGGGLTKFKKAKISAKITKF